MKAGEKVKAWLKDKNNLILIAVLLFVFVVRLYFFIITKNQPLWWDEADYMSLAKSYAGIVPYNLSVIRLPGFSLLASLVLAIGIKSDAVLRFFLAFIPSLVVLGLTYKLILEMYEDKTMAIISLVIMTFIWEHIFYSNRFQTENLALIFQYFALIVLIKCYVKREKAWFINSRTSLLYVAIFVVLSVLFRPGNVLVIPAVVLFILLVNFDTLKGRKKIGYSIITIILLIGSLILFNLKSIPLVNKYYHPESSISFATLGFFYGLYQPSALISSLLFYFFIFGIIVSLFYIVIMWPEMSKLIRDRNRLSLKADILNWFLILSVFLVSIFLMRAAGFEYRWFFLVMPAVLSFTAKGMQKVADWTKRLHKFAPLVVMVLLLMLNTYGQYTFSKSLIEVKLDSYSQVRDAGLWIKENSNKEDTVVTASVPQTVYYSERKTYNFALGNPTGEKNETYFDNNFEIIKPKYLILSGFEPSFTPAWAYSWPQNHSDIVQPVKVYYADEQKTQPILVIYKINY